MKIPKYQTGTPKQGSFQFKTWAQNVHDITGMDENLAEMTIYYISNILK